MAAFFQTIFKSIFFNENVQISIKNSPARRQAIFWNNGGSFTDAYMRHSASMS